MKKLYLPLIFILLAQTALAQQATVDSLLKRISTSKEDTIKVWLLLKVADIVVHSEPPKARTYIQQAEVLSQKLKFNTGIIRCNENLGESYSLEGNTDSAMIYMEKNLKFTRQINDSLQIGIALLNIGALYRELSEYEKALSYSLEGKAIFERKKDASLSSQVNDALQILYYSRTEYDKAITYGIEAVAQARKQTDPILLLKPLINLSLSYTAKQNYEVSNKLLNEALELGKPMQNPRVDAVIMQNLGEIALKNYNIPLAEQYVTKCLAIYKEIGDLESQSICLRGLSVCYLQSRNFSKALQYADSALAINRKNGYIKEEAAILREISLINYAMGDIKEGYLNDDKSNLILEDLIKKITSEQSANLEKKYETAKKEGEIIKLQNEKKIQELTIQKKNQLNYLLMSGALISLALFLLAYRNYKQKQNLQAQRISELEKEKQLLATEAVLKGESQERTRLAKDLHDGLGGMLSGIKFSLNTMKGNLVMTPENSKAFEKSLDMLDSSISEMRRVAHNMMPEALVKFGLDTALKDFCFDINQSGAIKVTYQSMGLEDPQPNQTFSITIYRIIQEILNNTLKHANAKTAIVQLTKNGNQLSVTVEDDGKGFDTSILTHSKGIGWTNIQNRIEFIKGTIDLQSRPGEGTSYHMEFPLPE